MTCIFNSIIKRITILYFLLRQKVWCLFHYREYKSRIDFLEGQRVFDTLCESLELFDQESREEWVLVNATPYSPLPKYRKYFLNECK